MATCISLLTHIDQDYARLENQLLKMGRFKVSYARNFIM
jgi:hypothetical protein